MQTTSNEDFKETKTILKEVESLFTREDILHDIEDIMKLRKEIDSESITIITDYHNYAKEYTNEITQKEKEIMAPSQSEHFGKISVLNENKENLSSQTNKLNNNITTTKLNIENLNENIKKLNELMNNIKTESVVNDKRAEYSLNLYNKITNITWDYDINNNNNNDISGYIGSEKSKTYKKFNYNNINYPNGNIKVTDEMWNLIESTL